jgi:hypothetical protein
VTEPIWTEHRGNGPLVAVAIHDGHDLRAEVEALMALDEAVRRREEDPDTGRWTEVAPNRLVALRSRFEVDLNRPRETAVYRGPADAWGLEVWRSPLPEELVARSLAEHDAFYDALRRLLDRVGEREGRFAVLDLHSYNHRRAGPDGPPADPAANPQINVGTGSMDRSRWGRLVDRFMDDLRRYPFPGGALDVRENVKFYGRELARFVHTNYPETGCALAVEVKKFFMDEWSGELDERLHSAIGAALRSAMPGLIEELARS